MSGCLGRLVSAQWQVEAANVICADLRVIGNVVERGSVQAESIVGADLDHRASLRRDVDVVGLSRDVQLEPEAILCAAVYGMEESALYPVPL